MFAGLPKLAILELRYVVKYKFFQARGVELEFLNLKNLWASTKYTKYQTNKLCNNKMFLIFKHSNFCFDWNGKWRHLSGIPIFSWFYTYIERKKKSYLFPFYFQFEPYLHDQAHRFEDERKLPVLLHQLGQSYFVSFHSFSLATNSQWKNHYPTTKSWKHSTIEGKHFPFIFLIIYGNVELILMCVHYELRKW